MATALIFTGQKHQCDAKRLLCTFHVQYPDVDVLDIEFLKEFLHRETLHCGQLINTRLVIIDLPMPLLDK